MPTTTVSLSETVAVFSEDEQDANWDNLSPEQRAYFNHLAEDDPERTGQAFFEEEVPVELQDKPELLEIYLDGGTVTTPDGETHEIPDRDWSHDVSRANGGSGSADNGRFEDASTNRARGSRNSTPEEQEAADQASDEDVKTLLESVDEVGEMTAWAAAMEVAGAAADTALDGLLPVTGGALAAKKAYDHFEKPADKLGWSSLIGGLSVLALTSPPGQIAVGGYVVYKLGKRGVRLWQKHVAS